MANNKLIYELELHEYTRIDADTLVTRVAGGWIYSIYSEDNVSTTFVPFNNEYQSKDD